MVGNWESGAWKVGQPGSSQRSGRKEDGSGYFSGLRRKALAIIPLVRKREKGGRGE